MIPRIDSIPFDRLLWLVPVFFTLHNLEEAPFMEKWSKRLPLSIVPRVTTRQFTRTVTFISSGVLGIAPFAKVIFATFSLQIGRVLDT